MATEMVTETDMETEMEWERGSDPFRRLRSLPTPPGDGYSRLRSELKLLSARPLSYENTKRAAHLHKIIEKGSLGPQLEYNAKETAKRRRIYITRYQSRLAQGVEPDSVEDSQTTDEEAVERLEEYNAVHDYCSKIFYVDISEEREQQIEDECEALIKAYMEKGPFEPFVEPELFGDFDNGQSEDEGNIDLDIEDSETDNKEPVSELVVGRDLEGLKLL